MSNNLPGVIDIIISVRAIIINQKDKILLVRRSKDNKTNVGKWEFVGGKMEQNTTISQTLQREVFEEVGIKIAKIPETINTTTTNRIKIPGYENILNLCISIPLYLDYTPKIKLSHEHDDYVWISRKKALKMDLKDEVKQSLVTLDFL